MIRLKRIGAYLLDIFLIQLVVSLLSQIGFINSNYKKYNNTYQEYIEELDSYQKFISDLNNNYEDNKLNEEEYNNLNEKYPELINYLENNYDDLEISEEEYDEIIENLYDSYEKKVFDYNYELSRLNVISVIISIIITIIYFTIFQYYSNGQTLGKKIMNLKVVMKNNEKVKFINLLFRTILLYGIIITIVQLTCLFTLSKNNYNHIIFFIDMIGSAIELATILTFLIRKDHRGLHDLICSTAVVENIYEEEKNKKIIDYKEEN